MTARDNTNSTAGIRRVRRRGNDLHVTFANGDRVTVRGVNGRYRSRYTFGATGGAFDVNS